MAKYKLKTKKAAAKRFQRTGSGKIKRKKAYMRHILTKKNSSLKRSLRKSGLVDPVDQPSVERMLPYK